MVELAIADNPALLGLLTIELERDGPSYSVEIRWSA